MRAEKGAVGEKRRISWNYKFSCYFTISFSASFSSIVEFSATRWQPWAEKALKVSPEVTARVPVWAVCTLLQPTDCLPYNQCCAACKQTVQGLSFWSDRAVFEKVQSSSEHTTSSLKILAWKWWGLLAQEVKGVTERLVTQLPHPSFTYPQPIHNDHIWLLYHYV